ncbi:MAG: S26 family signal peptidase [Thermoplasmata archaeon]|nr:S26 family signal peptidase [Thermoplasmata archaeon]
MEPTLRPGDRVLVDRSAYRLALPEPGDLVAASDPSDPQRWLVKRVAAVGPGEVAVPVQGGGDPSEWPRVPVPAGTVFLLSDALAVGRDGRRFGPLPISALRGRVWYRYAPAEVRGRLDPPRPGP